MFESKQIKSLQNAIKIHQENFESISSVFKSSELRLRHLESEAKIFRAFLDHMNIHTEESSDGSIVFKCKYKYTKVGHDGAVERCN